MDRPPWIYKVLHRTAWAVAAGLRGMEFHGLENVPSRGRVIVACNHISVLDPPLAALALGMGWGRYPRLLAKQELFSIPLFGALIRVCGSIPLDRGRGDVGAIRAALAILEGEGCLIVFPEGTRARGGRPLRPKAGVGLLARETGAPVVPARIRGTDSFFKKGPLTIRFGAPLRYCGGDGRGECQIFAERVMGGIWKL